jgi:hypothetical protein
MDDRPPFTPYTPPSDDSLHAHIPTGSPQRVPSLARTYGLHPFVAFGRCAVDQWGAACGKGLLVGIMTAVPTSLPSVLTAAWGVLGLVGMMGGGRRPPPGPDAVQADVIDMRS